MKHLIKDPNNFYKVCTEVLNQCSPNEKKQIRGNNKLLMNKVLSKAIMLRTKLKYKFLEHPIQANRFS